MYQVHLNMGSPAYVWSRVVPPPLPAQSAPGFWKLQKMVGYTQTPALGAGSMGRGSHCSKLVKQ